MKKEQANTGNTRILGWKVLLGASSAVPYFYVSLLFLALFSSRNLLSLPFNWFYGLFIFLLPAAMSHYIWFRSVAPELGSSETIKDLIPIHVIHSTARACHHTLSM
jgi:hypothetical protein